MARVCRKLSRITNPSGLRMGWVVKEGGLVADVVQRLTMLASEQLAPGETVVAGARCSPRGSTKRRTMGAGLGGLVGALAASKGAGSAGHVLYGEALPHDIALGLTDRRILIYSVSSLSGKTTKVLREIPLAHVGGIEHDEGRFLGRKIIRFSLCFSDGSRLELESPSGAKDTEAFCHALDTACGHARAASSDQVEQRPSLQEGDA